MSQTQPPPQSKAAEVWKRLAGMFGAEALARKYGEEIPDEWTAMLGKLTEFQVGRGVRMLAFSGKQHVPSLPEFVKLCRDAEHDREFQTKPTLPAPDDGIDKWAVEANRHLLKYITTRVSKDPKCLGEPATREAMQDPARSHLQNCDADPRFVGNMHILVAYKNRWAGLVRELDVGEGVSEKEQQDLWANCMREAEAQLT